MFSIRRAIDSLIYISVALGVALLPQLYGAVPSWLFDSVLGGWLAYLIVAVLAAMDRRVAYPCALVLAILTLTVSLPQPEHQSFVGAWLSLAAITFLAGSLVQITLIVLLGVYFWREKFNRSPS